MAKMGMRQKTNRAQKGGSTYTTAGDPATKAVKKLATKDVDAKGAYKGMPNSKNTRSRY